MSDGMFLGIKSSSSWVTGSLDATSSGYNLLTGRLIYWYNGFWLYIFTVAVVPRDGKSAGFRLPGQWLHILTLVN